MLETRRKDSEVSRMEFRNAPEWGKGTLGPEDMILDSGKSRVRYGLS